LVYIIHLYKVCSFA